MKFDWYEATVAAHPDEVVGEILRSAGQGMGVVVPRRGTTYGYERAYDVMLGSRVLAAVFYGGGAQGEGVHVSATGSEALWWSKLCRAKWEHQVTRVDAAEDYSTEGSFDVLTGLAGAVAKERGLRTFNVGDWLQGIGGRTLYVGSIKSAARVRVYEKGKEYASRGVAGVSPHWARIEGTFRPRRRPGRIALAAAQPMECFGLAAWTRDLAERLNGFALEKIEDVRWEASEDDRAYAWCIRQYGQVLVRRMLALGSWEAVGAQIGDDITKGGGK